MKYIKLASVLFLLIVAQSLFAQEKYAVIINAYAPDTKDPENSWALANPTTELYFEFWNDVYLMWEMLVFEKGYDDDNVIVVNSEAKGSHNFTLDMNGLPPGVYFCSVYVNGLLSDTKKMLAF